MKPKSRWYALPGAAASAFLALTIAAMLAASLPLGSWAVNLPKLRPLDYGPSAVRHVPPLDRSIAGIPPSQPPPTDPPPGSFNEGSPSDVRGPAESRVNWFEHRTVPGQNDEFSGATLVSRTPFRDRTDATATTRSPADPPARMWCGPSERNVWYRYEAPSASLLWVDTRGSAFDTSIVVYEGRSLQSLRFVKCNDNESERRTHSRLSVITESRRTYFIEVAGRVPTGDVLSSSGALVVQFLTGPVPSDRVATSREIRSLPFFERTSNQESGLESGENHACFGDGSMGRSIDFDHTLWFALVPARTSYVVASTEGSEPTTDTVLSLYERTGGTRERLACNDDTNDSTSRLIRRLEAGRRYLFQVGTASRGVPGEIVFTLRALPVASNDRFGVAAPVTKLPIQADTPNVKTGIEQGEPRACARFATLWYRIRLPQETVVWVTASSTDLDPAIAVFEGSALKDLRQLDCATRGAGLSGVGFDPPMVTFRVRRNAAYFVQVGSRDTRTGSINVAFRHADPPLNDERRHPFQLDAVRSQVTGVRLSSLWATTESDEPRPFCGPMTATLWFRVRVSSTGAPIVGAFPDAGQPQNTGVALAIALYRETAQGLVDSGCETGTAGAGVAVTAGEVGDYLVQVGGSTLPGVATRGSVCVAVYEERIPPSRAARACHQTGSQPEAVRRSEPVVPATYSFDASDEGFQTRNEQVNSVVGWDPLSRRVMLHADRQDAMAERFERDLEAPIDRSRDFRVGVRHAAVHQGNGQLGWPMFLAVDGVDQIGLDPGSAGILYSSRDFNIGHAPQYYFFFDDGLKHNLLGTVILPANTAYQFVLDYRAATHRLVYMILGPSGVVVSTASLEIAPTANFRFTKIGVASFGHQGIDSTAEDPLDAWTDDIGVAFS